VVQGAGAETAIAAKLIPLVQQRWKFKFNQPVPRYGDVNVFAISPNGNLYPIKVKAIKGKVHCEGGRLFVLPNSIRERSFGGRNLLLQCRGQAEAIRVQYRIRNVYLILCFANAVMDLKVSSIDGVEIVTGADVVERLQLLDRQLNMMNSTPYC
jgi:hypothetical protein